MNKENIKLKEENKNICVFERLNKRIKGRNKRIKIKNKLLNDKIQKILIDLNNEG